jgi:hypothetical protein
MAKHNKTVFALDGMLDRTKISWVVLFFILDGMLDRTNTF